ncbi:MAG: HAD-IC family P-type ATPase, partial [Actinomycetota bacterium]
MSDACCGTEAPPSREEPDRLWQIRELRFAAAAGLLALAPLLFARSGLSPDDTWFYTGALVLAASTFVPETLRKLARGKIGVGTLMTIAAVGAVLLGEMGEAAMLAFLFAISEGLEEYSLAKARHGLRALLSLVPEQATLVRDGAEVVVAAANLRPGDRMVIRPGERLATDGAVRSGCSALDLSAITGESVAVEVAPGDEVYAGSINGNGVLQVDVTAAVRDNSLARIVRIVEAEQSRKGASQRLADRVARPMVPGVMVLAAAIAGLGSIAGDPQIWIERSLVVLVAASPCALAISVPVTVVAAVGAGSRMGVLIKGGAALEALGRIRGVAFDKTGTLTRN